MTWSQTSGFWASSGDFAKGYTMFRKDLIDVLLGNPMSLTQIAPGGMGWIERLFASWSLRLI
jgi:hypothetical protein